MGGRFIVFANVRQLSVFRGATQEERAQDSTQQRRASEYKWMTTENPECATDGHIRTACQQPCAIRPGTQTVHWARRPRSELVYIRWSPPSVVVDLRSPQSSGWGRVGQYLGHIARGGARVHMQTGRLGAQDLKHVTEGCEPAYWAGVLPWPGHAVRRGVHTGDGPNWDAHGICCFRTRRVALRRPHRPDGFDRRSSSASPPRSRSSEPVIRTHP